MKPKLEVQRDLAGFVNELVDLAEKIEQRIPPNPQKCADEKNFFLRNFLHRNVDYANNVVTLVKGKHSHAAVLVARAVFEGIVYLESYRKLDDSLAKKWCYYSIYEVYREKYERYDKTAADKWLRQYAREHEHGAEIVENAQKEFVFDDRKQNWHQNLGKISNLFEKLGGLDDPDLARLAELKRRLYDPFSKVAHWTPQGVTAGDRFTLPAISLTFECLHWVSKAVTGEFDLDFDDDLGDLWRRYLLHSADTLGLTPVFV